MFLGNVGPADPTRVPFGSTRVPFYSNRVATYSDVEPAVCLTTDCLSVAVQKTVELLSVKQVIIHCIFSTLLKPMCSKTLQRRTAMTWIPLQHEFDSSQLIHRTCSQASTNSNMQIAKSTSWTKNLYHVFFLCVRLVLPRTLWKRTSSFEGRGFRHCHMRKSSSLQFRRGVVQQRSERVIRLSV